MQFYCVPYLKIVVIVSKQRAVAYEMNGMIRNLRTYESINQELGRPQEVLECSPSEFDPHVRQGFLNALRGINGSGQLIQELENVTENYLPGTGKDFWPFTR